MRGDWMRDGRSSSGAAEGTSASCGTATGGRGRTGAGAISADRPPACDAGPGGSPTAANAIAVQQAAIAAANASRLPGIGRLSAQAGRVASRRAGVAVAGPQGQLQNRLSRTDP